MSLGSAPAALDHRPSLGFRESLAQQRVLSGTQSAGPWEIVCHQDPEHLPFLPLTPPPPPPHPDHHQAPHPVFELL